MGRTRNIIQTCNGRKLHLPELPNVTVQGYYQETNDVFEYLGCLGMGVCMPNRHKPIGSIDETLQHRYEKTMARLQKIK